MYGFEQQDSEEMRIALKKRWNYKITSVFISAALCLILGLSLIAVFRPSSHSQGCIADIYQDGELLTSIPLDSVDDSCRFTVTGENGCVNEIEIRPGSIGVVSADCPDRLCVHQGFIDHAGLPIVCLPNKLVILLRESGPESVDVTVY